MARCASGHAAWTLTHALVAKTRCTGTRGPFLAHKVQEQGLAAIGVHAPPLLRMRYSFLAQLQSPAGHKRAALGRTCHPYAGVLKQKRSLPWQTHTSSPAVALLAACAGAGG